MSDRDVPSLIRGLRDGGDRREAAIARLIIAVLRELMGRPEARADVRALDMLLAVARDSSAERRVRAAAVSALPIVWSRSCAAPQHRSGWYQFL